MPTTITTGTKIFGNSKIVTPAVVNPNTINSSSTNLSSLVPGEIYLLDAVSELGDDINIQCDVSGPEYVGTQWTFITWNMGAFPVVFNGDASQVLPPSGSSTTIYGNYRTITATQITPTYVVLNY